MSAQTPTRSAHYRLSSAARNPGVRRFTRRMRPKAKKQPTRLRAEGPSRMSAQTPTSSAHHRLSSAARNPGVRRFTRRMRPKAETRRAMGWECRRGRAEGSREGAHPRVQSAAAACTLRGRNRVTDFYLAAFPPGRAVGPTGNAVRGVTQGGRQSPLRSLFTR